MTLLFTVLTFLVAFATYCITKRSYRYTRKREKKQIEELIRSKEAQLKAMGEASRWGVSYTESGGIRVKMAALSAEIEQLKELL